MVSSSSIPATWSARTTSPLNSKRPFVYEVMDRRFPEKARFTSPSFPNRLHSSAEAARQEAHAWLDHAFPGWQDPTKYWDLSPVAGARATGTQESPCRPGRIIPALGLFFLRKKKSRGQREEVVLSNADTICSYRTSSEIKDRFNGSSGQPEPGTRNASSS